MILYIMCFFLFLVGVYGTITKRDLIKIILGIGIMGYSVNLFLVLLAYRTGALAPILKKGFNVTMVDPIPQAMVLTSIVIELGITALMAALAIRIYQKYDTFDITEDQETTRMILSQFIFVPLLAAFLIVLIARKKENIAAVIALAACAWILIVSFIAFFKLPTHGGMILNNTSGWRMPYTISLILDNLSSFMLIVVNLVSFLSAFYAMQYINHFTGKMEFLSHSLC